MQRQIGQGWASFASSFLSIISTDILEDALEGALEDAELENRVRAVKDNGFSAIEVMRRFVLS